MNSRVLILVFAGLIMGLLSCKKGNGDVLATVQTTNLNVVNASADTLNFYDDGTRVNNGSNLYPDGSLGYQAVTAGAQSYQFKKAGSPNTLVDISLTLDVSTLAVQKLYSIFIAGETADKVIFTRDTLVSDTGARVRFVNASPITGTLDVTIGNTFNYKKLAFKSATGFIHVNSGKNTLTIYQSGSTTPLAQGTLTLNGSTSYTLFTRGQLNGTGNSAFAARILTVR